MFMLPVFLARMTNTASKNSDSIKELTLYIDILSCFAYKVDYLSRLHKDIKV